METLNIDELYSLGIMLDLPDLLRLCEVSKKLNGICKNRNLWIYKIKKDFPNYKRDLTILNADELKSLYLDMKKYALPSTIDPNKIYYIVDLYKAVEKDYNTKEEFEKFVKGVEIPNLILDKERNFGVLEYIDEMEGSGLDPYRRKIFFHYPTRKTDYGLGTPLPLFYIKGRWEISPDYFIIWGK